MMKQEIIYDNKYKIIILFIFSIITIGGILLGFRQSIDITYSYKNIVNWGSWIILYFLAQFSVMLFIGKMIKGSDESE